jgi:hypothetical protein
MKQIPCILLLLLSACEKPEDVPERAFYHWETRLELTAQEVGYLQKLLIKTLYVRFFDVDLEAGVPVPLAEVQIRSVPSGLRIVPAVFITNRTIRETDPADVRLLAEKIVNKVIQSGQVLGENRIRELHVDCDWTEGTRDRYFALLQEIKSRARGWQLSVTLRLHQWKYAARTGVPPADLAILMCYNTGDLERWEESNSILSDEALRPYLDRVEPYPLPMGIALPVFRWGVIFRDGRLVRLLHGLEATALRDPERFTQIGINRFMVKKNTYLDGHYLYHGDRIRLESTDAKTCKSAARLLRPALRRTPAKTVALYHIEPSLIQRMPYETAERVFKAFSP